MRMSTNTHLALFCFNFAEKGKEKMDFQEDSHESRRSEHQQQQHSTKVEA